MHRRIAANRTMLVRSKWAMIDLDNLCKAPAAKLTLDQTFGDCPDEANRLRFARILMGQRSPLEAENIDDDVRFAVEQNNVTANQHVRTIWRRRRQTTLQFDWSRIPTLFKARGKCSVS